MGSALYADFFNSLTALITASLFLSDGKRLSRIVHHRLFVAELYLGKTLVTEKRAAKC